MRQCGYIAILFGLSAFLSWAKEPEASLLPQLFNGWQITRTSVKTGSDPAAVDPADSAGLNQYGFVNSDKATYTRNGRNIEVKAARFKDSSGAFGAFTFYVQPQMQKEDIGARGVSNNSRVLFY